MSQRFPKDQRLRKRREFLAVQQAGRKFHGRHFLVLVVRGPSTTGRVGVTVSKKVGNAVTRNRIKRWVREFVRTRSPRFVPDGCDAVVVAKQSAGRLRSFDEVERDLGQFEGRLRAP